jgi:UDP-N-acetyl-D-glucosamine dehydrogenase
VRQLAGRQYALNSTIRRVVVVGQGYVGLPAAHAAVVAGHTVVGYDVDADKTAALAMGRSPIDDLTDDDLAAMLATGRYEATSNPARLAGFDVALVAVPTPLRDGRPDLSAVLAAAQTLSGHLQRGATVVLESTVAPGTTAGEFRGALEENSNGLTADLGDIFVGFSPERIDPGNPDWHFRNTPKLVSGVNRASADAVEAFYATICDTVVRCASTGTAEMAKLLENTYRHVNIALVNELGRHANELDISIWDVIAAARTKPYGYQAFYPGPGVGGHCLPIDPAYLSDRIERTLGRPFDFVDLAMRVNDAQPGYVAERVMRLLNEHRQSVNGARVLVLGLAYKADSGDIRESPTTRIIDVLRRLGAVVSVCDPRVRQLSTHLADLFSDVKTVSPHEVEDAAGEANLTLLVTDHRDFPYERIAARAKLVLDARNRFARAAHVHAL